MAVSKNAKGRLEDALEGGGTATKPKTTKPKAKAAKKRSSSKRTTPEAGQVEVKIQPLNQGRLALTLIGTSPLVTNNFSHKARQEMLENQTGVGKKSKKEPRSPDEEFLGAFYVIEGDIPQPTVDETTKKKTYDQKEIAKFMKNGVFGMPLTGFREAMISACRNTDMTMAGMKQCLTCIRSPEHHELAVIKSPNPPEMDARICRLANGTPIERFRPMWKEWSTEIEVVFDANQVTVHEVANLVAIAGAYVGVCEGRPEKCSLAWGRWEIEG